jgi:hypothetical protein
MNLVSKVIGWLKAKPKSAEDVAAAQEAARIRAEMKTNRAGAGSVGENYDRRT